MWGHACNVLNVINDSNNLWNISSILYMKYWIQRVGNSPNQNDAQKMEYFLLRWCLISSKHYTRMHMVFKGTCILYAFRSHLSNSLQNNGEQLSLKVTFRSCMSAPAQANLVIRMGTQLAEGCSLLDQSLFLPSFMSLLDGSPCTYFSKLLACPSEVATLPTPLAHGFCDTDRILTRYYISSPTFPGPLTFTEPSDLF